MGSCEELEPWAGAPSLVISEAPLASTHVLHEMSSHGGGEGVGVRLFGSQWSHEA